MCDFACRRLMSAEIGFMDGQHVRKEPIRALNLFPMASRFFIVVTATTQLPIVFGGKMCWATWQSRRVVRAHKPRGHMRALGLQMSHAGIDMIPRKLCAATSMQRILNIRIELAEIVICGGVGDRLDQAFPLRRIGMVRNHRLGTLSRAFHNRDDVIGIPVSLTVERPS
jgi:hypothetical protein